MKLSCQKCGNSMFSESYFGTEDDGNFNYDFCSNCYKDGKLYHRDWDGDHDSPTAPFKISFPFGRIFKEAIETIVKFKKEYIL